MTNFDFLLATPAFESFADVAVAAERIYAIDPSACVLNCRRAMEIAVKWMYAVDGSRVMPWDDKLVSLMNADGFRDIVDDDILRRMDFIRRIGNIAAHEGKKITRDQAQLCLRHLFSFMDFVAYCYADSYEEGRFDPTLLDAPASAAPAPSLEKDVRIDVMRASGNGGQCVNTTDSAVRLTHYPTGIVIYSQTEKSQLQNKAKAWALLRSKLYDLEMQKRHDEEADLRRSQIGTGDRSEKIRTYNFPQGRVTDHRIKLTLYKIDAIMNGDLDEILDSLTAADQAAKLLKMNGEY